MRWKWPLLASLLALSLTFSCYSPIYDINLSKAKPSTGPDWAVLGGANFTGGGTTTPSLAIAPDGSPFVGFVDGNQGNEASVMYRNANSWLYLGSPGFNGASIWDPAIAIDSGSQYYLAFRDESATSAGKISVYRFSSSWAPLGSLGFSPDVGLLTCLAFDPSNIPYVAYRNPSNMVTVMSFNGSSWNLVGSAGFSPSSVSYLTLAVDPAGTPYVGFQDDNAGYAATVMRYNSGTSSWDIVGVPGFSGGWANYTSLAIDSGGTAFIAFQDSIYVAKVMKSAGTSWADVGNAALTSGNNVDRVSLAISKAPATMDALYLAYARQISSVPLEYGVSVIKYNGSSWDILGSRDFYTSSAGLDYLQLAIAPNDGTPYVSIQSGGVTTLMALQ